MDLVTAGGMQVARTLYEFVNDEAIPGTGVEATVFWQGYGALVRDLAPRNKALLDRRDELQRQIDAWHLERRGKPMDIGAYTEFLRGIGYLQPEPAEFSIGTENVDPEIASIAGPQLVVPVTNARYALNAANARWGSLYDALYGTDAIPEDGGATRDPGYNAVRGARVIAKARQVLDQAAPLAMGSHRDATHYGDRRWPAHDHAEGSCENRTGAAGAVRRLSRRRRQPDVRAAEAQRAAHRDRDRSPRARSDNRTRPALPTCCWRPRSRRSRTARTRSPASMPTTRWPRIATGSA